MRRTYPLRAYCLVLVFGFLTASASRLPENPDLRSGIDSRAVPDDFKLTDQDGKEFKLSQLRGRLVLLFFGYTSCPDACPGTLSKLSRAYKLLGPDKERVVTVFVSVDPAMDTPQALKKYLQYFRINSIGLTGTKEEIDSVVSAYGAKYEVQKSESAMGYHINHSTDLYLLDQEGKVAHTFTYSDGVQVIADRIKSLMQQY